MGHNHFAGEVPFPLVGGGAVLRFRTIDLIHLRAIYGTPPTVEPVLDENGNPKNTFWGLLIHGLLQFDPVVYCDLLKHGLKKADGKTPLGELDFEDLPFPYTEAFGALMDGLLLARDGRLTKDVVAATEASSEADKADPPQGSETGSTSSSGSSEQGTAPA